MQATESAANSAASAIFPGFSERLTFPTERTPNVFCKQKQVARIGRGGIERELRVEARRLVRFRVDQQRTATCASPSAPSGRSELPLVQRSGRSGFCAPTACAPRTGIGQQIHEAALAQIAVRLEAARIEGHHLADADGLG